MRKKRSLLRYLAIFTMIVLVFNSCKKKDDDDDTTTEKTKFEILTEYMTANNMDLSDMTITWTITAHDLDSLKADYYIIDIRNAGDYDTLGHITGAVNTTLANVVTQAGSSGSEPIVVACYTGQSAAHAVVALRLSGYPDAKILKFGMSSWNLKYDKWTSNTGNIGDGHANWTTDATTTVTEFSYPDISTSETTGAAILAERVNAMLNGGFLGVSASDVLDTPANYFINNYWAEADVTTYGHIAGAYRIKEQLTLADNGFKYLDKDKTIVTYCWTGQTSSVVTAYLTVLGYNAKSLKFGANAMIYDQLLSGKWASSGNYPD